MLLSFPDPPHCSPLPPAQWGSEGGSLGSYSSTRRLMSEALPKPDSGGADPAKRPRGPGVCVCRALGYHGNGVPSSQRRLAFPACAPPPLPCPSLSAPGGSAWAKRQWLARKFSSLFAPGSPGQVSLEGNRWTADCRCLQPASARAPAPPG